MPCAVQPGVHSQLLQFSPHIPGPSWTFQASWDHTEPKNALVSVGERITSFVVSKGKRRPRTAPAGTSQGDTVTHYGSAPVLTMAERASHP